LAHFNLVDHDLFTASHFSAAARVSMGCIYCQFDQFKFRTYYYSLPQQYMIVVIACIELHYFSICC